MSIYIYIYSLFINVGLLLVVEHFVLSCIEEKSTIYQSPCYLLLLITCLIRRLCHQVTIRCAILLLYSIDSWLSRVTVLIYLYTCHVVQSLTQFQRSSA